MHNLEDQGYTQLELELDLEDLEPNFLSQFDGQHFDYILEELYLSSSNPENLSTKKSVSLKMGKHKDPKGGLTKEGIEYYNRKTGSNLKPGVTWKPRTAEDFRRKGSFLTRFYTNPSGPLVDKNGNPTRLAKAATKWGEPIPRTMAAAARLAAKGRNLLKKAKRMKEAKSARVQKTSLNTYESYSIPSKNPNDYLVVEDRDKVSTYRLQVKENGKPNPRLMGAAWRALYHPSGHRGNPYKGPYKDKAKRKLRALYKSLGREMPRVQRNSTEALTDNESLEHLTSMKELYYDLLWRPIRSGRKLSRPRIRRYSDQHPDQFNPDDLTLDTNTPELQEAHTNSSWRQDMMELIWDELDLPNTIANLASSIVDTVLLEGKFSKQECQYLENPPTELSNYSCSKCIFFDSDSSTCSIIEPSDVNESAWCRFNIIPESNDDYDDEELVEITLDSGYTNSIYTVDLSSTDSLNKIIELNIPENYVYLDKSDQEFIVGKYSFDSYTQAIMFAQDVATKAESIKHHPQKLLVIYTAPGADVYVELSTNDEVVEDTVININAPTYKDIYLADYCNNIYRKNYKYGNIYQNLNNNNLSNSIDPFDNDYEAHYYVDQLNLAMLDSDLSDLDSSNLELYSKSIFLDKDKHEQAKAEAKTKFRVYPSVYANMWMVKRYKELGGKFRSV